MSEIYEWLVICIHPCATDMYVTKPGIVKETKHVYIYKVNSRKNERLRFPPKFVCCSRWQYSTIWIEFKLMQYFILVLFISSRRFCLSICCLPNRPICSWNFMSRCHNFISIVLLQMKTANIQVRGHIQRKKEIWLKREYRLLILNLEVLS